MRHWLTALLRGPFGIGIPISVFCASVAVELGPARGGETGAVLRETRGTLAVNEERPAAAQEIGRHPGVSVHQLLARDGVAAHYHRRHDETVTILAGEGVLTVGEEKRELSPGLVVMIPRGVVHSVVVTGAPVEAVSVFSPPFDGDDRHFVE